MYSVAMINSKGETSFLSIKGKTAWKTKRTAIKHAKSIADCRIKPFDVVEIKIENEFREVVKRIL